MLPIVTGRESTDIEHIMFHVDTQSYMMRQKKVEKARRAVDRSVCDGVLRRKYFDEELSFLWSDRTAFQCEQSIFSFFYVWDSAVAAQIVVKRICRSNLSYRVAVHTILHTFLCGASIAMPVTAIGSHYWKLVPMRGDEIDIFAEELADGTPHVEIYRPKDDDAFTALVWCFNQAVLCTLDDNRILLRTEKYDSKNAEFETTIPYFIQLDGKTPQ